MTTAAQQYRALVAKLEAIQGINEAETFPTLKIGDVDPRNGKKILSAAVDGSGNVIRNSYGDIWNVQYGEADPAPAPTPAPEPDAPVVTPVPDPAPDVKPLPPQESCGPEVQAQIAAQKTFTAAYALAKKSGCPTFDWCQIVRVPEQGPMPAATPSVSNPMGDADPTAFSGNQVREALAAIRNIEISEAPAAQIPEIKASTKTQAIAIAQKKGIKVFKFCSKYKVQAAKKPVVRPRPEQGPLPAPTPSVSNPMGDADPTAFSGNQVR